MIHTGFYQALSMLNNKYTTIIDEHSIENEIALRAELIIIDSLIAIIENPIEEVELMAACRLLHDRITSLLTTAIAEDTNQGRAWWIVAMNVWLEVKDITAVPGCRMMSMDDIHKMDHPMKVMLMVYDLLVRSYIINDPQFEFKVDYSVPEFTKANETLRSMFVVNEKLKRLTK